MFAKTKTGTRILASFALVVALVVVLAGVSHRNAGRLADVVDEYGAHKLPSTAALWSMRQAETAVRSNLGLLANPLVQGALRADADKRVAAALERIEKNEQAFAALHHGEEADALWRKYAPLDAEWNAKLATLRKLVSDRLLAASSDDEQTSAALDARIVRAYEELTTASAPLQKLTNDLIEQTAADSAELQASARATVRSTAVGLWGTAARFGG